MSLHALACLYLKGNELVRKYRNYRKSFIVAIGGLKYLDDRPVPDDERECAVAWQRGGQAGEQAKRAEIN